MLKYCKQNIIYFLSILISIIIIFSAIIYKIYSLDIKGITLILILSITSYFILFKKFIKQKKEQEKLKFYSKNKNNKNKIIKLFFIIYLATILASFYVLFQARTDIALISPWEVTPLYFFALYSFATFLLATYIIYNNLKINNNFIILFSIHFFLSFSIAIIIYKIGYGFDSFIHQSTISLIDKIGSVDPKPLYYLGQYGLTTIIHKITSIPIAWIDKLLVPFLTAIFMPYALYSFLQKNYSCNKTIYLTILVSLAIPFSIFITTTPQNFAYLFLMLTILYGLACTNVLELTIIYIFALSSFAIHPIAGIPAIFFTFFLHIYHSDNEKMKKYLYILVFILSSIALPLIFFFINTTNDNNKNQIIKNSTNFSLPKLIIPEKENFILNAIYFYCFNIKIILTLLAIIGIIISLKYIKKCKIFFISLYMSLSLLISFILIKNISFVFLIDYEKNNYSNRILVLIVIFLTPFILSSIYFFLYKILKEKKSIQFIFLIFITLLITTSLYISYPRFDKYYNSHGYSVSKNDLNAVNWIETNHKEKYIVLANQQVSVSALREFGFSKYIENSSLKEKIYFYPIPTGCKLYEYFLSMVYEKPSKKTMLEAMEFANVNESYFILNKYWWAFSKILEEAKLEADNWHAINNGEIYIFQYLKK